ncbi:MAG: hypothetical protein JSS82_12430, partial [Bacteroidetes bacterium]|nr:hypothetical protein [Bacteroidota bacterium]
MSAEDQPDDVDVSKLMPEEEKGVEKQSPKQEKKESLIKNETLIKGPMMNITNILSYSAMVLWLLWCVWTRISHSILVSESYLQAYVPLESFGIRDRPPMDYLVTLLLCTNIDESLGVFGRAITVGSVPIYTYRPEIRVAAFMQMTVMAMMSFGTFSALFILSASAAACRLWMIFHGLYRLNR